MPSLWKRLTGAPPPAPVVVERMSLVEVPVLTETKKRVARGETGAAVVFGFTQAIADVSRAYGIAFPPELTPLEFIRWAMGPQTPLAQQREIYERAYAIYEPVRYWGAAGNGPEFIEALTSIYAAPEMARLYAALQAATPPTPTGGA